MTEASAVPSGLAPEPPTPGQGSAPRMSVSRPDVIRVILADDHLVVRAGLKALLGASKDIEVVGEATNGRDAIALVDRLNPHIAVLDLDMPQMDGLAATNELV